MVYPIGMSASPAFTVARALGLWHDGWIELISDRRDFGGGGGRFVLGDTIGGAFGGCPGWLS